MVARSSARDQNISVHIHLRDRERRRLFKVEVDLQDPPPVVRPPGADPAQAGSEDQEVYLDWEQTIDDQGFLRHCPVCGCRELFVRKDFPQVTGFVLIVLVAVAAMVLFSTGHVLGALAVLAVVALVDFVIYFFTGRCLVCYRCRSGFRGMPIRPNHPGWELSIGEKYRQILADEGSESAGPTEAEDPDRAG